MLKDKIAVVTGGGRGIGKGITLSLANAGAEVLVLQRSELDKELSNLPNVSWAYADISNLDAIQNITQLVEKQYGALDIIVNNAGVMSETKLDDLALDEWQKILTINTTFPLFLIKNLLPLLRKKGGGSIINIGSVEGISANPDHTAYCTSKAALQGMTRSLAVDLGPEGIRCNAIAPGWIDTDLNENLTTVLDSGRDFQEALRKLHPVRRTGKAEDIARLVKFLASDESSFITGQIIIIDGGRTAMLPVPS